MTTTVEQIAKALTSVMGTEVSIEDRTILVFTSPKTGIQGKVRATKITPSNSDPRWSFMCVGYPPYYGVHSEAGGIHVSLSNIDHDDLRLSITTNAAKEPEKIANEFVTRLLPSYATALDRIRIVQEKVDIEIGMQKEAIEKLKEIGVEHYDESSIVWGQEVSIIISNGVVRRVRVSHDARIILELSNISIGLNKALEVLPALMTR